MPFSLCDLVGPTNATGRIILEFQVDAPSKHVGIQFDEYQDMPADVKDALEHGKTILAICELG